MNPAEWLQRAATRDPDAPALFRGAHQVANYGEFLRSAAGIGAALGAQGIGPGSRVAVFMANRTEYLEALYGIWFCGAAAVPINAKLHEKEAVWIIENAEAVLVLTDDKLGANLKQLLGPEGAGVMSVDSETFSSMREATPLDAPVGMDRDDLLWLFYTSGTTGKPKGVRMSTGNLMAMTFSYFIDVDDVRTEDAILYAAPMSHGAGIYNFMHVIRGGRHVVPESGGFDPSEILDLAEELDHISMFAAPTMVKRLVDVARADGRNGKGIKTIVYAGGPMYEADILDAVETMGPRFVQIYGQGECPMAITALSRHDVADRIHPRWRERLNSVGVAQCDVRVRIVDENGREVARGDTGEIVVRGAPVMMGYWRNDEASAKTIRDGWLWTGDMGRMDEDGYISLIDRSKDMIISGGSNIYPREVEEVLLMHPDVSEVAVVGRPHPEWGEEVIAFVVPIAGREVAAAALDQMCLDQIARFKRPKHYRFVDALPKNNYGKVLKTDLRERLLAEE
ncbi:MAG: AMP-binding protein [Hyphomicrobiaceae bacterium]|nr:AMP-binding protein [Hyphomicrobiaceae bacterium]MCC0023119.1 AMP-binding protein [Hyphomicrobiaceae bacterium]